MTNPSPTPGTEDSIDAVILWVDGADREHRRKRDEMRMGSPAGGELVTGRDKTRFIDNGELRYCLRSIRAFAPWIRTIHLVTDNQTPSFLNREERERLGVHMVDHSDIFKGYEWALPTFNNRTIESAIWRIPDLAGRFIFFNDDFLLAGPVRPEDFFSDGKVVLRGRWNIAGAFGPVRMRINEFASRAVRSLFGITRSMHHLLQIRSARLAGFRRRYFRAPHLPHPVRTRTAADYFREHPERFEQNIRYRFRSTDQFSMVFLANHLEIASKNAILRGSADAVMINGETDFRFSIRRKLQRINEGSVRFVCLQGMERIPIQTRMELQKSLEKLFT